jgi:P27 family predicted phage terminase small subunit
MGLRGPIPKDATRRQGHRQGPALTVLPGNPPLEPAKMAPELAKTGHKGPKIAPESAKTGPKSREMRAPKGLLAATKRIWAAYWQSPVSRAVDREADRYRVERWITTVDEYERINAIFKQTRIVKGSTGQPVLNPLSQYLQQLLAEINKAETELGLTPLARMRLGIAYGEAQLTALELARALDELGEVAIEPGVIDGEWEAV